MAQRKRGIFNWLRENREPQIRCYTYNGGVCPLLSVSLQLFRALCLRYSCFFRVSAGTQGFSPTGRGWQLLHASFSKETDECFCNHRQYAMFTIFGHLRGVFGFLDSRENLNRKGCPRRTIIVSFREHTNKIFCHVQILWMRIS
jgi:hypothetical protein